MIRGNITSSSFFSFFEKQIHTREREICSNAKVPHKLHSEVIVTFKGKHYLILYLSGANEFDSIVWRECN